MIFITFAVIQNCLLNFNIEYVTVRQYFSILVFSNLFFKTRISC